MTNFIKFKAEDVIHLDDVVNHLFGIVRLQDVRLTAEQAEALRTLEDKAERYRQKGVLLEMLNGCFRRDLKQAEKSHGT